MSLKAASVLPRGLSLHLEETAACTDQDELHDDSRMLTEEISVHVGWASEPHPNMQQPHCEGRCEARLEARCSNAPHYYALLSAGSSQQGQVVRGALPNRVPHALTFACLTYVSELAALAGGGLDLLLELSSVAELWDA